MLTVTKVESDDTGVCTQYACNFTAACDGSSIWADTTGRKVQVTAISVHECEGYKSIYVTHNSDWQIYTDNGFAAAISNVLGYNVDFTEQGMQEDNFASMEAA